MNSPRAYLYRLPLTNGKSREGILLCHGNRWGDAAPLPGWSRETLEEVKASLHRSEDLVPASLRCAREALEEEWDIVRREIPLNALLDGTAEEIFAGAVRASRAGCRCLKIKTARVDSARLVDLIKNITRETHGCQLRLDSNRSWSFEETLCIAETLREFPIEYFEEPLSEAHRLPELIAQSVCRIALDETLREISPADLESFRGAVALVLKPTLLGGFEHCRQFALEGDRMGMNSVVSGAYESGVGIHTLGRFAASLPRISAAGLDTYSRLESDVLASRLDLSGFEFRADQPLPAIDESRLVLL